MTLAWKVVPSANQLTMALQRPSGGREVMTTAAAVEVVKAGAATVVLTRVVGVAVQHHLSVYTELGWGTVRVQSVPSAADPPMIMDTAHDYRRVWLMTVLAGPKALWMGLPPVTEMARQEHREARGGRQQTRRRSPRKRTRGSPSVYEARCRQGGEW